MDEGPRAPGQELDRRGQRGRVEAGRTERQRTASGAEVEEAGQERGARDAVQDGVVDLGHQGRPVVFEALDHHHLPEGTVAVEGSAGELGDQPVELAAATGLGKGRPGQVVVELEVGVVDPDRVAQPEGDRHRPLAERRHQGEPGLDLPADLREAGRGREERPPTFGGVHDQDGRDVQVRRRGLEGQKGAVEAFETVHVSARCARSRRHRARRRAARRSPSARTRLARPAGSPAGRCGHPGWTSVVERRGRC